MLIDAALQIATAIILGVGFADGRDKLSSGAAAAALTFVCLFIAGFAWSWGPMVWVIGAEVQVRGWGGPGAPQVPLLAALEGQWLVSGCGVGCDQWSWREGAVLGAGGGQFPVGVSVPRAVPCEGPPWRHWLGCPAQTMETRAAGMSAVVLVNFLVSRWRAGMRRRHEQQQVPPYIP